VHIKTNRTRAQARVMRRGRLVDDGELGGEVTGRMVWESFEVFFFFFFFFLYPIYCARGNILSYTSTTVRDITGGAQFGYNQARWRSGNLRELHRFPLPAPQ
jgi:hypothetical protein